MGRGAKRQVDLVLGSPSLARARASIARGLASAHIPRNKAQQSEQAVQANVWMPALTVLQCHCVRGWGSDPAVRAGAWYRARARHQGHHSTTGCAPKMLCTYRPYMECSKHTGMLLNCSSRIGLCACLLCVGQPCTLARLSSNITRKYISNTSNQSTFVRQLASQSLNSPAVSFVPALPERLGPAAATYWQQ